VLWEELHEQLDSAYAREDRWPMGSAATRRSAELAERIADLASTVALLAGAGDDATRPRAPATSETTRAAVAATPARNARPVAVLIDERDEQADASRHEHPAAARRRQRGAETSRHTLRRGEVPTDEVRASNTRLAGDGLGEHDRGAQPAWLGLIGSALAEFERDRLPFAVLLVELLDVGVPASANAEVERAVARALDAIGPASIAPEDSDHYWLLVPETDRLAARVLADRLARAFGPVENAADQTDPADRYFAALSARTSQPPRGHAAPLRLAVGTAVCPEDGRDVSALVAQAHIELAAARSASPRFVAVTESA
jgi:GGDEF-like domain